jgi:hypothetical protein
VTFTFKMMMGHVADGRLDGCATGYQGRRFLDDLTISSWG